MAYQLSSRECYTIIRGQKQALESLISRVIESGETSVLIPLGSVVLPEFDEKIARDFDTFLSSANITQIKFNRGARMKIRSAMRMLRNINSAYDFNTSERTSRSRKRTLAEAQLTTEEADLSQAPYKSQRGRNDVRTKAKIRVYETLGLSIGTITTEMYQRVTHPESIHQGPLLCCGVASLTSQLLATYPNVFEDICWDLVTYGRSEQLAIPLCLDQAKLRKPGKITVAEVFMNALNNCKTYIGQFGIPFERLQKLAFFAGERMGLTRDKAHFQSSVLDRLFTIFANMPRQIVNLLHVFGFKVIQETTFFTPMELLKRSLPEEAKETAMVNDITYSKQHKTMTDFAAELHNLEEALSTEGHHVLMMLDLEYNNKILKCQAISTVDGLPRLTHYVYVPQFKVDRDADTVTFDVFTFGESYHVTENLADFQKGYRGAIISTPVESETTAAAYSSSAASSSSSSSSSSSNRAFI